MKRELLTLIFCIAITMLTNAQTSKEATISNVRKFSATQGGFGANQIDDKFGGVEVIGDLDGDGNEDLAVGAFYDDDGYTNAGAIYILFLNKDRSIKSYQKISSLSGNFKGKLSTDDNFGFDIASLGDLDGDGVIDLAVGARYDTSGAGAVWILFMNSDGTVKSYQKISKTEGGLEGLETNRLFGNGVASLGDLNGDGTTDIAVGTPNYCDDKGTYIGCVFILFLNEDGTVKSQQEINDNQGGFTGSLESGDKFGNSLENIGDFNKDGVTDIAVYAGEDDDGATNAGAFYILFLNTDGTANYTQKISATEGGFKGSVSAGDHLGIQMANLGDINGDEVNDLLVCCASANECATDEGKAYIFLMNWSCYI